MFITLKKKKTVIFTEKQKEIQTGFLYLSNLFAIRYLLKNRIFRFSYIQN